MLNATFIETLTLSKQRAACGKKSTDLFGIEGERFYGWDEKPDAECHAGLIEKGNKSGNPE
jgi:hypothetical protein